MSRWRDLHRAYPGLGWEDLCVKLGIRDPAVRAEIRAAILRIPAKRGAGDVGASALPEVGAPTGQRRSE